MKASAAGGISAAALLLISGLTMGAFQGQESQEPPKPKPLPDAVEDAQTPRPVKAVRPEQQKNAHDKSNIFSEEASPPSSPALNKQNDKGRMEGFDFARDPLGSTKPKMTLEEIMKADLEAKPKLMALQRKLLESRYNLTPKLDKEVTMTRGKPLAVGPTARLADGMTWDALAKMSAADIKKGNLFPYPSLPHPKHAPGGQVFPQIQMGATARSTSVCARISQNSRRFLALIG